MGYLLWLYADIYSGVTINCIHDAGVAGGSIVSRVP